MSEIDSLRASEALSIELRKFLLTDVGQYLTGCSTQDISEAKDSLLELDPYKYTTIQDLQNAIVSIQSKARVAMALQSYIGVAIVEGDQAAHQLSTEAD